MLLVLTAKQVQLVQEPQERREPPEPTVWLPDLLATQALLATQDLRAYLAIQVLLDLKAKQEQLDQPVRQVLQGLQVQLAKLEPLDQPAPQDPLDPQVKLEQLAKPEQPDLPALRVQQAKQEQPGLLALRAQPEQQVLTVT